MKYTTKRYEKVNGRLFVAVLVDDEQGHTLEQEYWLNDEDNASVLSNESNLPKILEAVAKQGYDNLQYEIKTAAKTVTPVVENLLQGKEFQIDASKINLK